MNGEPGTGNYVKVNENGIWRFAWYTSSIRGIEKLQTARYYITAFDQSFPEKTTTTSVYLKKPEFFVTPVPASGSYGEYIQLTGMAEKGSGVVQFEIADASGKVYHNYDSSVSGSGYFNKGFHIDMPPGVYTITLSSPTSRITTKSYLVVNASTGSSQVPPQMTAPGEQSPALPTTAPVQPVTPAIPGTGSLRVTSTPAGASVFLDSQRAGTTPVDLNAIAVGQHHLELNAPGYLTTSLDVNIREGQVTEISPVMIKTSSATPLSAAIVIAAVFVALVIGICWKRRDNA